MRTPKEKGLSSCFRYYNCNPHHRRTDDCVIRAIAAGTGDSWQKTLKNLTKYMLDEGYMLSTPELYGKYLEDNGWKKQKQPKQKDGKKVRIKDFVKNFKGCAVVHAGNGHVTYEKDPNDHHKLIVEPIAAEVVRKIFQEFLNGKNYSQIATELSMQGIITPGQYKKNRGENLHTGSTGSLHIWASSTIKSILTDEMYVGTLIQGRHKKISYKSNKQVAVDKEDWMRYENAHVPIIDKKTFDKVQKMVGERHKAPHTTTKKNIYSGIIFCGECGHAMGLSAIRTNSTYSAFYCKYYKQGANFCTRKRIKVSIISDAIIVALNQYLKFYVDFKEIMKASKEGKAKSCPKTSKIELENQLNGLKDEKKDLYFQYKNEGLTDKEYSCQRQKVDLRIAEIQKALESIESKQQESLEISENGFVSLFRKYKKFTKINSDILNLFVKKITVYSSRSIEIEWKFRDELIELVNLAIQKGIELSFNEQDTFEIPPKGSHRDVF